MTTSPSLELHNSWPGTTIDGAPGIVSGHMELSCMTDGSVSLSLTVGDAGASPEDCVYTEFVLSPDQADALTLALQSRRRENP